MAIDAGNHDLVIYLLEEYTMLDKLTMKQKCVINPRIILANKSPDND
jgi:hypothetical protein